MNKNDNHSIAENWNHKIFNSRCCILQLSLIIIVSCWPMGTANAQVSSTAIELQSLNTDTTQSDIISSRLYKLRLEEFNKGINLSIFDMIKGRAPGLGLYKRGGDPNGSYTYRLRGLSSLQSNRPLIVVDGMILTSPDIIEPDDIRSVNILREVAATSSYGFQGSSGVIEITTKGADYNLQDGNAQRFHVEYNGYVAFSNKSRELPALDRQEYLASGGKDLGGDTDWQEIVSRRAFTHTNNISISGGNVNTSYRLSVNLKNVEGILRHSGFEQINGRASVTHRLLDDKLRLNLNLASTKRESNFSFIEGFRYAAVSNPTSPVRFENGNYFQPILFDNFNPLAILELNTNDGQSKNLNFNTQASFDIIDEFQISANFGQQFNSASYGEFYPSNSLFRGLTRDGLARRTFEDTNFTFFETRGTYHNLIFKDIKLTATAGYSFQEYFTEDITLELGNLPTNELGYYTIDLSGDRVLGNASNVFIDSFASPEERIIGYFGRLAVSYDDKIFVDASLRREGSTRLGTNKKWGLFPAVSVGIDFTGYWKTDIFSHLTGRIGYGETGTLPDNSGLSTDRYEYTYNDGGTVSKVQEENPDLKWEDKREINFGIDYGMMKDRLSGSLNLYQINISDFILGVRGSTPIATQYQNVGEIKTRGWDFSLNYDLIGKSDVQWNTGLILSSYKSELISYSYDEAVVGSPGAPGQGSALLVRHAVGEEIGQIWGPVFSGEVDEDGNPVMVDINNDGQFLTDFGSSLGEDGDFAKLGNAIPDLELGWTSTVKYKNWEINALFRGAFGHSLVNLNRMFYEPIDQGAISSYNRIITNKAVEGLTVSRFSSLYVEKADFLKLDQITVSHSFNTNAIKAVSKINAYFTIENAFTLTGYTGLSSEPVLEDLGPVDNGARRSDNPDMLIMGIDRRMNYLPSRSFIFGVNLIF